MADIARRGANQLGHFVVRLVLGAIDLEQMLGAAVQNLGERFDGPRLARPGRAQKQEDARRSIGRIEARLVGLDHRE